MKQIRSLGLMLAAATTSLALSGTAFAESTTVRSPNRVLFRSGVATLGTAYVVAFVVGVESPRAVDHNLFIPVAGPWMDLAQRGCANCDNDRVAKVLLVTDGVFQGIGALNILGAFLFPEVRVTAMGESTRVAFTPTRLGGHGYGVAAFGEF